MYKNYGKETIKKYKKGQKLHNFVIFMILVKRTLNRMTSLEGTQSR